MKFECLQSIKVSMCGRIYAFVGGNDYEINSDKNNSELEIFENFLKQKGNNFRLLSGPKLLQYRSLVETLPTFIVSATKEDVLTSIPTVPFSVEDLGNGKQLITSSSFIETIIVTNKDGVATTYSALPAKPAGGLQQENTLKFYLTKEQYKEFSFDTGLDISSLIPVLSTETDGVVKIINNADITYRVINNRYVVMKIDIKNIPEEIILTIQVKG